MTFNPTNLEELPHLVVAHLQQQAGKDGFERANIRGVQMMLKRFVVDLLADHGAARDEVLQRLLGERSRVPLPVVAGLAFLRSVDAEQPHELRAELHGIAIYDLEAWLCARSGNGVVIGFRVSGGCQYEGKNCETPH